jgi:hypothetical protein
VGYRRGVYTNSGLQPRGNLHGATVSSLGPPGSPTHGSPRTPGNLLPVTDKWLAVAAHEDGCALGVGRGVTRRIVGPTLAP